VNCNTPDNSMPMSLFADNKVIVIDDAADSGKDELSINYIKSVCTYLQDISWSSQVVGSQIYQLNLSPSSFRFSVNDANGLPAFISTPVAFLGDIFDLYRGSMKLKILINSTPYHGGTLSFTFIPGIAPGSISVNDTAYPYRLILDIQTETELEFLLPYCLPRDYIKCTESIGSFYVHVVNPLTAPATVSSTVDMSVFISGGPDLEFQSPAPPTYAPIVTQGADITPDNKTLSVGFGDNSVAVDTRFSELCIGENIRSLSQVIKAFWNLPATDITVFANAALRTHRFYAVASMPSTTTGSVTNPAYYNKYLIGGDILSSVASLFAFYRGSMRYRFTDPSTGSQSQNNRALIVGAKYAPSNVDYYAPTSSESAAITPTNFPTNSIRSHRVFTNDIGLGNMALQIPYYNTVRMSPVVFSRNTGTLSTLTDNAQPSTMILISTYASSGQSASRAAGDDFQFMFFLGVPLQKTIS